MSRLSQSSRNRKSVIKMVLKSLEIFLNCFNFPTLMRCKAKLLEILLWPSHTNFWLRYQPPFRYGQPFVSKLWHDVRAVFSHVYLQSFLLHDRRAFFVTYTCVLFPSIWPFSYKRAYICAQKSPYICVTNKHVVYGVTERRRIRGTELYRPQKNPSCTMELKSNFSLNQAWPQWPRLFRVRFGSYS